jgi:molybdopterin converting factor small subunit
MKTGILFFSKFRDITGVRDKAVSLPEGDSVTFFPLVFGG